MAIKDYDYHAALHEVRMRRTRKKPQSDPPLKKTDEPLVTVLCASNRPGQLDHVLASFAAQDWKHKELVLVTNADGFAALPPDWPYPTTVLAQPPRVSLGECLNAGRAVASGTVLCRFDDDDCYEPDYLSTTLDVFRNVDAQIVGKSAHYVRLLELGETILRFPNKSNCYVGYVAGGTISEYLPATSSVLYPDLSIGEDTNFTRTCERKGLRVWSSTPNGFTQVRSAPANHTWQVSAEDLKRGL